MKTYNERTQSIMEKAAKREVENRKKRRRITATCCTLALVLIVSAVLFTPSDLFQRTQPEPDYNTHEYAKLISSLKPLTITSSPSYSNLFDRLFGSLGGTKGDAFLEDMVPEIAPGAPMGSPDSNGAPTTDVAGKYEEITDNQVEGVIEGDLIKRSDKYIFYLRDEVLSVYSIEGENSQEVGSYCFIDTPQVNHNYYGQRQMYLSADCTKITIISGCYFKEDNSANVAVINLDVTDPANIIEYSCRYVSGSYLSSRMVDGQLYLMTRFYVPRNPDFDKESTYVPQYGYPGDMESVPMQDICIPTDPASAMYTVIHRLDGQQLNVQASSALLSYAGVVYMSKENIYLTRAYTHTQEDGGATHQTPMTEITRLNYDLGVEDTFAVPGTVNNQYNLDEYNGFLRIVTTTGGNIIHENNNGETTSAYFERIPSNASLYCIFLGNGEVWGSVKNFAPDGESVQSVRFDGDKAYVCTSLVLQDPVFFFDLSDVDNITYKDTGTIPGYSMSLVDFTNEFLLGIGYGDSFSDLKIEIYREGESSIESHCMYQRHCGFSADYKSYYIDRENRLIGLGLDDYNDSTSRYLLLFFDGYELIPILDVELNGINDYKRAVYIDNYLYTFGDHFLVLDPEKANKKPAVHYEAVMAVGEFYLDVDGERHTYKITEEDLGQLATEELLCTIPNGSEIPWHVYSLQEYPDLSYILVTYDSYVVLQYKLAE